MREAHGRAEFAVDAPDNDRQRAHEDNTFYPVGCERFAQRQQTRSAEIAEHQHVTQNAADCIRMLLRSWRHCGRTRFFHDRSAQPLAECLKYAQP